MSRKTAKSGKETMADEETKSIATKTKKCKKFADDSMSSVVANVNKAEKFSVDKKKTGKVRSSARNKSFVADCDDPEISFNNNASISTPSKREDKISDTRSPGSKRKTDGNVGKSPNTNHKRKKVDLSEHSTVKEVSDADKNQIGIQTGGVLHMIQVGNNCLDGIELNVDTGEFDIPDNEMADSDEDDEVDPNLTCQNTTPVKMPKATTSQITPVRPPQKVDKPINNARGSKQQYEQMKGDVTMKRLFDEWMEERLKRGGDSALGKQIRSETPVQGGPIRKTNITKSPCIKSPSDTTIYAPVLRMRGDEQSERGIANARNNVTVQDVSNFVDAIRLETEEQQRQAQADAVAREAMVRSQPPGQAEALRRSKQAMIESEKFQAAISTPPAGNNSLNNIVNHI